MMTKITNLKKNLQFLVFNSTEKKELHPQEFHPSEEDHPLLQMCPGL